MALIGAEGLWCGASLRPWQILHSTLAEMHTCGTMDLDVWELIDQTVEAAYPRDYEFFSENKRSDDLHSSDRDDGELWKHGGLMEAKIRDWLISKLEAEEEDTSAMHTYHLDYNSGTSATYTSEFSDTWEYSRLEEDQVCEHHVYTEENEGGGGDNHSYTGGNMAGAAVLAAPLDTETHYCQFSGALQTRVGASLHCTNEEDELCAVCLEKLYEIEELQGYNTVTRLPCRHSFHSRCLSPWLTASTFCPCCRAPVVLAGAPDLEAPPDVGMSSEFSSACTDRVEEDMMGLLAEMEAALDRFGLLS